MERSGRAHATPDRRVLIVELAGAFVKLIQKFSHLIRRHDGDRVERDCFRGYAWSALRILRVIAMESEDDEEIDMAAERAEIIATKISEWLEVIARSGGAHSLPGQRLYGCQKHVELGRLARLLGEKFWVPLIDGRYSGTGPSGRAMLRTFFYHKHGNVW